MNKNKAFKLAEALESGKYKQGQGWLNKNNQFCCLGVACEINNVPKIEDVKPDQMKYDHSLIGISGPIAKKLTGFSTKDGSFIKPIKVRRKSGRLRTYVSLMGMNDEGLSFKFIAKILRKHYKNII